MDEAKNLTIGVKVSATERQMLESLKAQAGLPSLSSTLRLLINQSAGIMPPRVLGRIQRHTTEARSIYEAVRG